MGYDLHITRAEHWSENEGSQITAGEWAEYVRRDPELEMESEDGAGFARWSGPSKYPDPWLAWEHGNVSTKNPDRALVEKMLRVARDLGARVQGDDGETYEDASQIVDPDEIDDMLPRRSPDSWIGRLWKKLVP